MTNSDTDVEVSWHTPGRILYTHAATSTDIMFLRDREILRLMEDEGKPPLVHLLIDCTAPALRQHSPKIIDALTRFHSHEEYTQIRQRILRHSLFGWVITVGEVNPKLQMTGKILAIKDGYHRHEAATIEAALEFLKRVDKTLRNLL